jgi:hypothetical protein
VSLGSLPAPPTAAPGGTTSTGRRVLLVREVGEAVGGEPVDGALLDAGEALLRDDVLEQLPRRLELVRVMSRLPAPGRP